MAKSEKVHKVYICNPYVFLNKTVLDLLLTMLKTKLFLPFLRLHLPLINPIKIFFEIFFLLLYYSSFM